MTFQKSTLIGVTIGLLASVLVVAYLNLPPESATAREGAKSAATSQPAVKIDPADLAAVERISRVFRAVAKKVEGTVVHIRSVQKIKVKSSKRHLDREFMKRFFGDDWPDRRIPFPELPQSLPREGLGSGVVIDSDGYILTNYHVVKEADKVQVMFADGRTYEPEWIRTDRPTDLAVIKIKATGLKALTFADSDRIRVGDWVVAVGNPFGLDNTVTRGIVSFIGRGVAISIYSNYIQTDAAINPGNSGGPLVNLKGEIVGINTAIVSRTLTFAGIGFAIPANTAKFVVDQLKTSEKVVRSYLGVKLGELNLPMAKTFDLDSADGALIAMVIPNTPASKANLKSGDVILTFDGAKVKDLQHLKTLVSETKPGTRVKMDIWRNGKPRTLDLVLEKMPDDFFARARRRIGPALEDETETSFEPFGITVTTLTDERAEKYNHKGMKGALITDVDRDSEAYRRGLRKGDLIVKVFDQRITSVPDFQAAAKQSKKHGGLRLYVKSPTGNWRFVFVPVDGQ